jgi:hypothetical protein
MAAEARPVVLRREAGRRMRPHRLGKVTRMPRGAMDRLINGLVPVRASRCRALPCVRGGSLRNFRFELAPGDGARRCNTRIETQ